MQTIPVLVQLYLLGDASIDGASPALGSHSLQLDGNGDSAKVYGFRDTPTEIYRF